MATLEELKKALKQKASVIATSPNQPLSDSQYAAGFDILSQGSQETTYQEFIIPQLSSLLSSLCNVRSRISVLEIGPGPESVLGSLPSSVKQKIKRYAAFEPNALFATMLEEWLRSTSQTKSESPLPCLESPPDIHRKPFDLHSSTETSTTGDGAEKFDIILFCHSMYGMKSKAKIVERALKMLVEREQGELVVVFHRDGILRLDGLTCQRTASFPTGVVRVVNDNEMLDCFAPFIAGFVMQEMDIDMAVRAEWRKVCRELGRREEAYLGQLVFSSPNIMAGFTRNATKMPELMAQLPGLTGDNEVKNREARLYHPTAIVKPTEIGHIQQCIRWALKYGLSLTVIGGGHSGQCLWPNVVSIDMSTFDQIHIVKSKHDRETSNSDSDTVIVVGSGCKSGDIVRKARAAGLVVPLGGHPSIGAGLWLQGGIGHLARLHGLACDAIIGAVVVSVASGEVLSVGHVPSRHCPADAVRAENETDMLWAIRGAGTNIGIVVSVTFKAYPAPVYSVRNWVIPLSDSCQAQRKLSGLDDVARKLPRNCSLDPYLYWDTELRLGVTMYQSSTTTLNLQATEVASTPVETLLGPENDFKIMDNVGLFETEMYMSGLHGEHSGGKTSSFKRGVFLQCIRDVAKILVAAVESRPSPFCYLHLLQGGGAVGDIANNATAFGCRDWDYACVITGVWSRDQDGTQVARKAVEWVYTVATNLLPLSSGAYGTDLGPDPRDAALAAMAFGGNLACLARLKHTFDPSNVLAYSCPFPKAPKTPKLIILVTGKHGVGKDHSAGIFETICSQKGLSARVVSISDATKREYAETTGADVECLLHDRAYKEQHRPDLKAYFEEQVRQRPQLPEENFVNVAHSAGNVDVLFITGMRDEAPVAAFSHMVPDSRLLDVRLEASSGTRRARRMFQGSNDAAHEGEDKENGRDSNSRPSLIFDNDRAGDEAAKRFCEDNLFLFFHKDLNRLADMVHQIPNFPLAKIEFRHVLGIAQQLGGLALCTSLMQTHFTGDWTKVNAIACCETGGFVFASALAPRVDVPLALIREAGKLPPPTVSVPKSASHITSSGSSDSVKKIEIGRNVISRGSSVVVVDDVFATGKTLLAVLQLLVKAGIDAENIDVLVVAEFPLHGGRRFLQQHGFGRINIQSLLVFGGA